MDETAIPGAPAPGADDLCVAKTRAPAPPRRAPRGAAARTGRARRPVRKRVVRWSVRREKMFLESLAGSSNVAKSARVAGLSSTTVYRRRALDPAFRAGWLVALREGFVRLEADLLDRALNGTPKDVWHGGKKVGTTVEKSERLALALLAAHRNTVMGGGDCVLPAAEEARGLLIQRLDEMSGRLGDET